VQLFVYLEKGASSNDDGASPKKHQQKYMETHKTIPNDEFLHNCFFEQCQNADHVSGILDQFKKEKKEKRP
jgi:hypothetical protein